LSEHSKLSSDSIGAIGAALAKAQGAMKNALADSENPHFKSHYANLASVWDAIRKPLADNNLSVGQIIWQIEGEWTVITTLVHSSGEWLKSHFPVLAAQRTSQGMGAAVTYARRFSLSAMVGVAQVEDDDGQADSRAPVQKPPSKPPTPPPKSAPKSHTTKVETPLGVKNEPMPDFMNEPQPEFDGPPGDSIMDYLDKAPVNPNQALAQDKQRVTPPTLVELAKSQGYDSTLLNVVCKKFTQKATYQDLTLAEQKFVYDFVTKNKAPAAKEAMK
jgi:hypothetical protein